MEPSSRPVCPRVEAGVPARPGWEVNGGLSDALVNEHRGMSIWGPGPCAGSLYVDSRRQPASGRAVAVHAEGLR